MNADKHKGALRANAEEEKGCEQARECIKQMREGEFVKTECAMRGSAQLQRSTVAHAQRRGGEEGRGGAWGGGLGGRALRRGVAGDSAAAPPDSAGVELVQALPERGAAAYVAQSTRHVAHVRRERSPRAPHARALRGHVGGRYSHLAGRGAARTT